MERRLLQRNLPSDLSAVDRGTPKKVGANQSEKNFKRNDEKEIR